MNTYYIENFPVTDELYHYGILGQKWGIRRYQNPDGTLTPAGKARYGSDVEREAAKDAQRMSDAKAAYGSGSIIRKRLISREITEKQKNRAYKKAYQEAEKYVDINKSYKRAEKLKKHEGTFNRGWELHERGKTTSSLLLKGAGDIGVTALTTGSVYYSERFLGMKALGNIMLAVGGVSASFTVGKTISDIHSLKYYERNRKF